MAPPACTRQLRKYASDDGEDAVERAAAQQSWATEQARAIVTGNEAGSVSEPSMAPGAYLGLGASTGIARLGLTVVVKTAPQRRALPEDDDV